MVAVMVVAMAVVMVTAVVMAGVMAVVMVMAAVTVAVMVAVTVAVTVPSWRSLAVQAAAVLRIACSMAGKRLTQHNHLGGLSWSSLAPQTDAR